MRYLRCDLEKRFAQTKRTENKRLILRAVKTPVRPLRLQRKSQAAHAQRGAFAANLTFRWVT